MWTPKTVSGPQPRAGQCVMGALYKAVLERTKAAFGRPIDLHLFRDIAATEIVHRDPARIGLARDLLGHGDLRAVDKRYSQASRIQAIGAILRLANEHPRRAATGVQIKLVAGAGFEPATFRL